MSIFGDDVNYNLEFRSTKDDGWYHCGVVLQHRNRLRVKFNHFDKISNDEVFSVTDFSTNDDVSKFLQRFRPESEPIGDNRCSRVSEGLMVSASCTGGNHLRKFDAVVEAVIKKKHSPEKCLCTCLLFWQHGPEEGHTTTKHLSNVYLIKSGSVDPAVLNFTKLVKEKVNRASTEFTLIPKNPYLFKGTSSNENITKPQDFGSVGHSSHDGFSAVSEGFFPVSDKGCEKETGNQHYLILENLETDVCPLFLVDFIHEHTLITAQAYIIPHLLSETCARAAIVVDKKTELETIYKFLNNPNHIIVSSSGRPWVLAEDKVRTGSFSTNLHGFPPMSEKGNMKKDLKVVKLGTEEYTKAKQQKDLYMLFRNYLNDVVQRLAMEEESINDGPAQ
ncbi:putative SAWADEE domain-containing protein [Helianthus anomalus]